MAPLTAVGTFCCSAWGTQHIHAYVDQNQTILDLWAHSGTIHEEYLVVFNTMQTLLGIAAVILTIGQRKFEYFVHLAVKCLFTPVLGAGVYGVIRGQRALSAFLSL